MEANDYITCKETIEQLCKELAEARAEIVRLGAIVEMQRVRLGKREEGIERKDALIEQMREALKRVRQCSCSHMQRTTHDMIDAALSAAERESK